VNTVVDEKAIPKKKKNDGQSQYKFTHSSIPLQMFKIFFGIVTKSRKECPAKFVDDEEGFEEALKEVAAFYNLNSSYLKKFKKTYIENPSFDKMKDWSQMNGEANEVKVGVIITIIALMSVKFIPLDERFLDEKLEIESQQTAFYLHFLSPKKKAKLNDENVLRLRKPEFRKHISTTFTKSFNEVFLLMRKKLQSGQTRDQSKMLNKVLRSIYQAKHFGLDVASKQCHNNDLKESVENNNEVEAKISASEECVHLRTNEIDLKDSIEINNFMEENEPLFENFAYYDSDNESERMLWVIRNCGYLPEDRKKFDVGWKV